MTEQAGHGHRRLGDGDDRDRQRFLEGVDTDAAEAGQDDGVRRVQRDRFQARPDHEGPGQVIAEGRIDVARAALGGDADKLGAGRGGPPRRLHDLGGDGLRAVRIDDEQLHPRILRHKWRASVGSAGSSRSTAAPIAALSPAARSCSISHAS